MTSNGAMTMCHNNDWHKAVAMSLSLRLRCPGLPIAVVADPRFEPVLRPYFDEFVPEKPGMRGFRHKLFIDEYSPFKKTFFLDADMIVMRDIRELMEEWSGRAFAVRGRPRTGGASSFGLNRTKILDRLNKPEFWCIGGAGHYYFEKPACKPVFDRAREILAEYAEWAPGARVADEDIYGIVMTESDIKPIRNKQIVGFIKAAKRGTLRIDALKGECSYTDLHGDLIRPFIIHFAQNMVPLRYHHMMRQLHCTSPESSQRIPWIRYGFKEFVHYSLWWGFKSKTRRIANRFLKL